MPLTKEDIAKNVAANFKYARLQLGLTQQAMGDKLGISQRTMQQIEYGYASAVTNVYKLSRLINVSLDTLYTTELSAGNKKL